MGNKLVSIFFISSLNPLKYYICRITGVINSQILGPKYDADSLMVIIMNQWDDKVRSITQVMMRFFPMLKSLIHYYRRHPIGYFKHLNCQSLNISIVYRDKIIFFQELIKNRHFLDDILYTDNVHEVCFFCYLKLDYETSK